MRKRLTLPLILVFLIASSIATPLPVKAETKTIVVPDDYPTIQEAVDNAPEGGRVFVKSGRYNKTIGISKPLSLIGEDPDNTIIETPQVLESFATIQVDSEDVTISGFTIKNSCGAIGVFWYHDKPPPSRCKIIGNKIISTEYQGIGIAGGENHVISGNYITGCWDAFSFDISNSVISGNYITGNRANGIYLGSGENVTIYNNTISNNSAGIELKGDGPFYVYGNNIADNQRYGILFHGCNDSNIYQNKIAHNSVGVELYNYRFEEGEAPGSGNTVYQNNFIHNSQQADVEKIWTWPYYEGAPYPYIPPPTDVINGTDIVLWDKGKVGNYWSDYQSKYPNATEVDASGIGNTPYVIDENNTDYYPLMQQVDIFMTAPTPTPATTPIDGFPPITIATIFTVSAVVTAIVLLVYFKKRKH
jgi:parallel beta-helix repeat protein